jgi:hypothetical protein
MPCSAGAVFLFSRELSGRSVEIDRLKRSLALLKAEPEKVFFAPRFIAIGFALPE